MIRQEGDVLSPHQEGNEKKIGTRLRTIDMQANRATATINTPKTVSFKSAEKIIAVIDFVEIPMSALLQLNRHGYTHIGIGSGGTTRKFPDITDMRVPSVFNIGI